MKKYLFLAGISCFIIITSCDPKTQQALLKTGTDILNAATTGTNTSSALSNVDVIKGLKEALTIGTNNSSGLASKLDGYYKNPRIFIPWPEEAKDMREKLMKMGFEKKITEFETSLNRAAEEAAKTIVQASAASEEQSRTLNELSQAIEEISALADEMQSL